MTEKMNPSKKDESLIGKRVPRSDARAKVSGTEKFIADYSMPNMLYVAVIRSPLPCGEVRGSNRRHLETLPGVVATVFAEDIPGENCVPIVRRDMPALAAGKTKYAGEPVGLIGAETAEAARRALAEAKLNIHPLPAVTDPEKARDADAPKVYGEDNVFSHLVIRRGDIEKAFAEAAAVVEGFYRTPYQEHAYLEPQGMLAIPEGDGSMTVMGSMQCPFYVQSAVATVLGLPLAKVRIIQTATGGAFGGKEDVPSLVATQAALIAWKTGRPARLIYSREEDILSMSKRHPAVIHYRSAVDSEGHLLAVEADYILDAGAYATLSPVVLWRSIVHSVGPYRCPNVRVDARAVATNRVPCGAFRGFGSPQILFAVECQMDQLAAKLRMEAAEIRRRNLLTLGDTTATGQVLKNSVGSLETLEKAMAAAGVAPTKELENGRRAGRGMSSVLYGVGLGAGGEHLAKTGAYVQILQDGSVLFAVGTTEMGQGMGTVLTQIVAEKLGAKFDRVFMTPTDTSRVPDSGPTVASRATTMSGNALLRACAPLRKTLLNVAADMLKTKAEELELAAGKIKTKETNPARSIELQKVIDECFVRRECMASEGWYRTEGTSFDNKTGQGDAYVAYAWATNIVDIEVDTETGVVEVKRVVAAHDVGRAVNMDGVEGQIEGGTVQGMGYGLLEEILSQDGIIQNPEFGLYHIPTAADAPKIEPIVVESPFDGGPYGAKGFGEQPLMGIAPAIVNAVADAIGVRLFELPITPERVLAALNSKTTK
jgi:CO/xanthine dehydrogenase Mo-binding subunit